MIGKYMYIKYALHFYYNMSPPENQDETRKIRRKKRENARHPTSVFPKNTFCKQNRAFIKEIRKFIDEPHRIMT